MPAKKETKNELKLLTSGVNKKTAKKVSKNGMKKTKRKTKPKPPIITEEMHEKWLFSLSNKYFVQLSKEWNERNLKIRIKPQQNYDEWLNYFKTLSPRVVKMLATTGQDILSTEAYSALSRWHDIIGNPHRIDKIHQSGLTNPNKGKNYVSITQLALNNDRLGVLKATRDRIAEKLETGAGARDTAALAREMTEIMTQISDYEKRLGPKKTTKLGQLLSDMPDIKSKRPSQDGGGARKISFRSRVTIDDLESSND